MATQEQRRKAVEEIGDAFSRYAPEVESDQELARWAVVMIPGGGETPWLLTDDDRARALRRAARDGLDWEGAFSKALGVVDLDTGQTYPTAEIRLTIIDPVDGGAHTADNGRDFDSRSEYPTSVFLVDSGGEPIAFEHEDDAAAYGRLVHEDEEYEPAQHFPLSRAAAADLIAEHEA